MARPVSAPISWNEPGSRSASMRSRTVSLPWARCLATFSSPPMRCASAATVQRYGALTTLVNNAAPTDLVGPGRGDRSLGEITDDAWDAIMTVALKQLVWCARHAVPHLEQADGASIVNISSAAAMRGVPGIDAYT